MMEREREGGLTLWLRTTCNPKKPFSCSAFDPSLDADPVQVHLSLVRAGGWVHFSRAPPTPDFADDARAMHMGLLVQ
jgi:hypothetical protein